MSNKNPFELRTDILAMAKDYLDRQYEVNVDFAQRAFEALVDKSNPALDKAMEWKEHMPKMYDVGELNKVAQQMYDFVNNRGE